MSLPAKHRWTPPEDDLLTNLVKRYGHRWAVISREMGNKSPSQVESRWQKCINPELKKGPFTAEEDELIKNHVQREGPCNWPKLKSTLPNRSPKQCRERWFHHLDPNINTTAWTYEEDQKIFELHELFQEKWAKIAQFFKGRTDNAIKNRWNTSIKKRIQIDMNGLKFLSKEKTSKNSQNQHLPHDTQKQDFVLNLNTIQFPQMTDQNLNINSISPSAFVLASPYGPYLLSFSTPSPSVQTAPDSNFVFSTMNTQTPQ